MESLGQIKSKISGIKNKLVEKYHLKNIAIFGSFARNDQNENSDIDIMVEFSEPIGIEFIDLAIDLEKMLNRKVDLVSRNGIKEKYYNVIKNDLSYV
jgi:predicted nucleotidyltransferase